MKFGLTEAQINEISTIIAKFPEIQEALIFGSRAMGNYKEASDVDIALKGDTTFSLAAKVKHELEEETYLPFFFDVLPYEKSTHVKLKAHIDQYGISFYRAGWKESVLPSINTIILNEVRISYPPLLEQEAIAAVLSSLDDKIDLLHRQNTTLEATAQTLFRYWSVHGMNFENMNTDSAVPGLNRNIALATDTLIPPQTKITQFNSSVEPLFHKITANKKQIRTLKQLRDTLLPKLMSGAVRVR